MNTGKKCLCHFISKTDKLIQYLIQTRLWYTLLLSVHLSLRLKCAFCDHALSVLFNFSHFQLLLWNRWMEFNKTWQEARYQRPLPSLCFSGRWEKQDGCPGLWLAETFSTSPLKPQNGIQRNLTGRQIFPTSSTKFVFFGPIGKKQSGCPDIRKIWLRNAKLLV